MLGISLLITFLILPRDFHCFSIYLIMDFFKLNYNILLGKTYFPKNLIFCSLRGVTKKKIF